MIWLKTQKVSAVSEYKKAHDRVNSRCRRMGTKGITQLSQRIGAWAGQEHHQDHTYTHTYVLTHQRVIVEDVMGGIFLNALAKFRQMDPCSSRKGKEGGEWYVRRLNRCGCIDVGVAWRACVM